VLFEDRANFLFGMTHALAGAEVWKERLLAGELSNDVAAFAGRVLGLIHERTATGLGADLADRTVFRQLRIEPFYARVRERRPEVAPQLTTLIAELEQRSEALCHGDFSPKNLLIHPRNAPHAGQGGVVDGSIFTLVDYETCHLGDPAFDLGFFLSHLILKAVRAEPSKAGFFDLTRSFWETYGQTVRFRPQAELVQRGIAHFAGCALARIDGTSPVDYLPAESQRDVVRRIGRRVLHEKPAQWDDVLGMVAAECRR
jgi:5-methylthioribose kinase